MPRLNLTGPEMRTTIVSLLRTAIPVLAVSLFITLLQTGCKDADKKARLLESANNYLEGGEEEKARIEFKNLLRDDPNSIDANFGLGSIWLDRGSPMRALPFLARADILTTDHDEISIKLATGLRAAGDIQSAHNKSLDILDRSPRHGEALLLAAETTKDEEQLAALSTRLEAIGKDPSPPAEYHLALASISLRKGDPDSAETQATTALQLSPDSFLPHLALASVHESRGNPDQAEAELKKAVARSTPRQSPHFSLAKFYLRNGRQDEAKQVLEGIREEDPDFLPPLTELARLAISAGAHEEASRQLRTILDADPDNFEARLLQGQLLLAKNEPEEALKVLSRLHDDVPGIPLFKYHLAQAYLRTNQVQRAIPHLETAVEINPGYTEAILLLADTRLGSGNTAPVVEAMASLLERYPNLAPAKILLARAHHLEGRLAEAIEIYRSLQESNPDDSEAHLLLGLTLRQQGSNEEARKALSQAERLAPDNTTVTAQLIGLDILDKNFEAAHQRVDRVLASHPDSADLHYMKATVQASQEQWKPALATLKTCLSLDANHIGAAELMISIHLATGDIDTALQETRMLLAANPDHAPALSLAAQIHLDRNDYAAARHSYEKLLTILPDSIPIQNNLAILYAEQFDELDQAYALATKARTAAPDNPGIADTLGWIHYKRGEYRKALELLQESAKGLPDSPEVQFHLGMASYMMGLRAPAIEALLKATAHDIADKEEALLRLSLLGEGTAGAKQTVEQLTTHLKEHPEDLIARMRLAELHLARDEFALAAAACEEIIKVNPELLAAVTMLAELHAGPLDDPAKAMAQARRARELAPDDPAIASAAGIVAYQTGNITWAHSLLEESNRQAPGNAETLLFLARSAYRLGLVPKAIASLRDLSRDAPDTPAAKEAERTLPVLECYLDRSLLPNAQTEINTILQVEPEHLPALMAKAALLEATGKSEAALESLRKLVDQYPDFPLAQADLSRNLTRSGDAEALSVAVELANKARQALPDDRRIIQIFAEANYRLEKYEYAAGLLEELSRKSPLDPEGLCLLGLCQFHSDDPESGRATLRRAVDAGLGEPLLSEARKLLSE